MPSIDWDRVSAFKEDARNEAECAVVTVMLVAAVIAVAGLMVACKAMDGVASIPQRLRDVLRDLEEMRL